MKRIAVSLLALSAVVGSTSVQAAGANCAKDYKDFWDNNSPLAKSLTPEQYAQLSRTALRGYDACNAGDERFSANNFFKELDKVGPNSKASDIFKSGAFAAPGAKKK